MTRIPGAPGPDTTRILSGWSSQADELAMTTVIDGDAPQTGYLVIRVVGDLDVVTAPDLGACLGDCVADPRVAVLDLRAVPFIGCSALAVIDAAGEYLAARGKPMVVLCGREIRRSLQVSGVDRTVTVLTV
ncbi:STAS domain-containing protein [Rhodococcus triatomae]